MKKMQKEIQELFNEASADEVNKPQVTEALKHLYHLYNAKPPKVVFLNSPLQLQIADAFMCQNNQYKFKFQRKLQESMGVMAKSTDKTKLGSKKEVERISKIIADVFSVENRQELDVASDYLMSPYSNVIQTALSRKEVVVKGEEKYPISSEAFGAEYDQVVSLLEENEIKLEVIPEKKIELLSRVYARSTSEYRMVDWNRIELSINSFGAGIALSFILSGLLSKRGLLSNKIIESILKIGFSGVFAMSWYSNVVFVCGNPSFVRCNDFGRLESEEDAALAWGDNFKQYVINGVYIGKSLFKALKDKTLTAKEIINLRNSEQKSALIPMYGYDKLLEELDSVHLDTWRSADIKHKAIRTVKLFSFEVGTTSWNSPVVVKVICVEDWSTGKKTFLGVPPSVKTAREAVAWTFGMSAEDYNLKQES